MYGSYVCMYVCMCTMVTMQQYCVMTGYNYVVLHISMNLCACSMANV